MKSNLTTGNRLRKLFALLLSSALFISTATFAVFVARGNTLTADGIVKTGTIRLDMSPKSDIVVLLDEQIQGLTNNEIIQSVAPGTYDLRVQKEGYTSWQQAIDVRSGLITDVSVQLFPVDLQLKQITTTNIADIFFSSNFQNVYYAVTDSPLGSNIGLWKQPLQPGALSIIEEGTTKITNLTSTIRSAISTGDYLLEPSPDNNKILITTIDNIYILNSGSYNEPSVDNEITLPYPVNGIAWMGSNNLLIRSGQLLIDYSIAENVSTIIYYTLSGAPVYTHVSDGIIYPYEGMLYKYAGDKSAPIKLENITLPAPIDTIYTGNNEKNIVLSSNGTLYFLNTTNSIITNLGNYELVSISPNGDNLIVNNGEEIKSIKMLVSAARSIVETQYATTGLTSDISGSSITWDINSNYFVFRNSSESNKVYTADNTGNNITLILMSENLTDSVSGIPTNNSGVIVKMLDDIDTGNTRRSNLYKVSFEE